MGVVGGERERERRTEGITGLIIRLLGVLLLHLQTPPQPLRVLVVRQRDGVVLALEVVQAV